MPPAARESWLESLGPVDAVLKGQLRLFLERHARIETSDFLDTLPKFRSAEGAATDATESDALRAGAVIGPYVIEQEIGRGGMGVVWRARRADGLVKRPVALKLLRAGFYSSELLARFARERDILAALAHPNIARLYDAGFTAGGQPFLALEFVEGVPLTEYCQSKRLDIRARLQLMLQVLTAVQYAHGQLIVHRDLKPSNILVMANGQVQLLDFGIAKLLAEELGGAPQLTQFGGWALTPDYASPEQIEGQPVSTASDVYSLGVIFYELLTGSRPYELKRTPRGALQQAILETDPRNPSQSLAVSQAEACGLSARALARSLKGDLDTIALKALRKDPHARYSTADAFAEDIQRYQRGEPLLAKPGGLWYRGRKFLRRYRLITASGAAIFAALAVGLSIALWQADRAAEQAQRAETEARTANSVEQFLQNIFLANSNEQTDPVKMRQMTARQLLDIGAKKIDTSLNDAPAAKLRMLKTLGDLDHQLALDDDAVALHQKQVALAKQLYGPNDARVASALVDLSQSMQASRSDDERDTVLKEALAILDRQRDFTSQLRGNLMGELAQCYFARDLTAALQYAHESVRLLRPFGPSKDFAEALIMEGTVRSQLTQYFAADALFTEALAVSKATQSVPNPKLVRIDAYLGEAQYFEGRWTQSERSYRDGLRAAQALGGNDEMNTIQLELRLGQFLFRTSRTEEGVALLKAARDSVLRISGADDAWYVPMILETHGALLGRYGDLEAGLADLSTATSTWRKFHAGTADVLSSVEREAELLIVIGRLAAADELLKESESIRAKLKDESTYPNGDVMARSNWLMVAGRPEEALKVLDRFAVKAADAGAVSLTALQRSIQTAKAHLARNDALSVIATLTPTREEFARSSLRAYLKTYEADTLLLIAKARLLLGQPVSARPDFERALSLFQELYDRARSPDIADAQVALANCYLELGQPGKAHTLFGSAEAIQATHRELGVQYTEPLRKLRARLAPDQIAR